jgi:hypothetical protein
VPTVRGELAAAAADEFCRAGVSLIAGDVAGRIAAGPDGDAPARAGARALREDRVLLLSAPRRSRPIG